MDAMAIDCEWTADIIVEFLRNKVTENRKDGICLGISGGVDSSVTAMLAVKAAKSPAKVHGLYLPDQDSEEKYRQRVLKLADGLKINFQIVDFSKQAKAKGLYKSPLIKLLRISSRLNRLGLYLYNLTLKKSLNLNKSKSEIHLSKKKTNAFSKAIFHIFKKFLLTSDITSGFISRHILRRQILEEYAEKHNLLLVGAANKSELLTGWFAPNGVDDLPVAPILGLYKNQVTQMAEHLNVPNEIINATPSPDMLKGIHDEDIIGFPYDKIDKVAYVVEHGLPKQHACSENITPREFNNIADLIQSTAESQTNKHDFPVFEPPVCRQV